MSSSREIKYKIPAGSSVRYCRGCGKHIYWIETARRKKMPVDPDGTPHFATCSHAFEFRKKERA